MGLVAIAAALGLMLGAAGALFRPRSSSSIPPSPLRLSVKLGADASLSTDGAASAFLSPEGMMLAFIARQTGSNTPQLYIRPLNQLQATPLAGTDDARNAFFSPNGQWIAFFAGGKLKKVSIRGGTPVIVCDAPDDRGGTWTDDDSIVFQGTPLSSGLMRVSSNGGKPEPLTKISGGEVTQRFPQILGGGKAVLYVSHNKTAEFDEANLIVQPLPDGPRKIIQRGGYYGRYLPSGHLLYIHENTLFAAPFDLGKLEATAQPVPVLEHISAGPGSGLAGRAQFAFSQNGTFVYLPGEATTPDKVCIDWLNRNGKTTTLRAIPANWDGVRFAPDGRRVAFADYATNPPEVWIYEWTRDMPTRLTSGGGLQPVWTPDGQRIAFGSPRGEGIDNLYWQRSDGTGGIQRLTESKNPQRPVSWHPRGKFLAFSEVTLQNGPDIMILPIEGDERSGWKPGKPTVFLGTSAIETAPRFSPDGRWIAYASNESGRAEVYVRPFPGPGGKWQVSNREAYLPLWSRTRRELFYEASDRRIMVAAYKVDGDSLRAEKPRPWSETRLALRQRGTRAWDLHPDGERFALSASKNVDTEVKQDSVVFIFNFFDELRRLAPVSK